MQKRSELEGGLNKSTEVIEGVVATISANNVATTVCQVTIRTAEVVDRRSHSDVVCDLEGIPEFPSVVAVSNEV